ncbi:MAG: hypothetical protein ACRCXC_06280 [Legionella sp.]
MFAKQLQESGLEESQSSAVCTFDPMKKSKPESGSKESQSAALSQFVLMAKPKTKPQSSWYPDPTKSMSVLL